MMAEMEAGDPGLLCARAEMGQLVPGFGGRVQGIVAAAVLPCL